MRAGQGFALLGLAGMLLAPAAPGAEGEGKRASTPPGVSQDGSRPSEGAIKGGSIDVRQGAAGPRKEIDRCRDLEGTLRVQCLEDARKEEGKHPASQ